uniref:Uncharacterized protein n=1 Tax=Ananas comosus var. bracteatus TaxID=296719 RepID=A0A6V7NW84_ANACO|nr:unnamed protein product [Ananas comosus var. bracteatus]
MLSCFSPLWVAFAILIGGFLLDVLISVSLVSALPVDIIIVPNRPRIRPDLLGPVCTGATSPSTTSPSLTRSTISSSSRRSIALGSGSQWILSWRYSWCYGSSSSVLLYNFSSTAMKQKTGEESDKALEPKVIRQVPQNRPVSDSGKSKPKLSKNILAGVFSSS